MVILKRLIRLLLACASILILALIAFVNIKLNYEPGARIVHGDTIQIELIRELRGVKKALTQNADLEMQAIYPEGYVFMNALYALSWSAFMCQEAHRDYYEEGHAEIKDAWMRINSETGKSSFNEDLSPPYGSFYSGWSLYVLGSKLRMEGASRRAGQEVDYFKQQCDRVANAIRRHVYPASYQGGAWPADVTVCIAALSIHDQLFEPAYNDLIEHWLSGVKSNLDPKGMIPHAVDPLDGSVQENARGSSMALTLIFLHEIDFAFANSQFLLFKRNFVDSKFGLTGIREYPKDKSGSADIDSGPVIFGFGGAATIVGMRTLLIFDEPDLSLRIRNAVELTAVPFQSENEKRYLFGALPMADAFIVWSHTGMKPRESGVSFVQFHIYSLLAFTVVSIIFWMVIVSGKNKVG